MTQAGREGGLAVGELVEFDSELLRATVSQLDAVAARLKLDPSVHAPSPQSSPQREGEKGEGGGYKVRTAAERSLVETLPAGARSGVYDLQRKAELARVVRSMPGGKATANRSRAMPREGAIQRF